MYLENLEFKLHIIIVCMIDHNIHNLPDFVIKDWRSQNRDSF